MNWDSFVNKVFPKVIGVGKNYLKHVIEMGGKDIPTEPVIFLKPWSSIVLNPKELKLSHPHRSHEIHHQIELGVVIKKKGSLIKKAEAMSHVGGYFLLLDMTDRDLQAKAKKAGLPWELSKGQDNFLPVSGFTQAEDIKNPYELELKLDINGKTVQRDFTGNMHYKIEDVIEYVSSFMTLNEGDLILTGTPEGVGPVKVGDHVEGTLSLTGKEISRLDFKVI